MHVYFEQNNKSLPDGCTNIEESICPDKAARTKSTSFTLNSELSLSNVSTTPLGMTHTTRLCSPYSVSYNKII